MWRAIFFSVLCCSLTPAASDRSQAQQPIPGSGAATAASSTEELLRRALHIQRRTSQLRGLRLRRAIDKGVLDREKLKQRVIENLNRHYRDEEIQAEEAVLKRLGLLPAGVAYKRAMVDLLTAEVAGFYDPYQRQLNLAAWIPAKLQEPTLVHEICHALQDQHFKLQRLTTPVKDNSDLQLARMAVVEGDCTAVMLEYLLLPHGMDLGSLGPAVEPLLSRALTMASGSRLSGAPPFLRQTLLFPYLTGLRFVQKIRARHPWSVVNRLYTRLPASTEQMLHYEKYWDRERPVRIQSRPLPVLAAAGLTESRRDVLGELILSVYLEQGVSRDIASRAAEGWGGDLLVAYRSPGADGPPLVLVLTSWDTAEDALEFANAQRHVLAAQGLSPQDPLSRPDIWIYEDSQRRQWSTQLFERQVLIMLGVPPSLRPELQTQVWERWRVGGRRVSPPRSSYPRSATDGS